MRASPEGEREGEAAASRLERILGVADGDPVEMRRRVWVEGAHRHRRAHADEPLGRNTDRPLHRAQLHARRLWIVIALRTAHFESHSER